jgi:integrase
VLPPRKGEEKSKQRRLALGVLANIAGIQRAEAEAHQVAHAIAMQKFDWADWIESEKPNPIIENAIAHFEQDYFQIRGRTPKTETTWKVDYGDVFKKLPQKERISKEILLEAVLSTKANTRSRSRTCIACGSLAQFVGIDFDANRYKGSHSHKTVQPRDLPSDERIAERFESISDVRWQWYYGMIACYGLRNHEPFYVDPESLAQSPGIIKISDGKTGPRSIFPLHPEWWEQWQLWDIKFPGISGKNNRELGGRVSTYFNRHQLGQALNLRHAWAIRSLLLGMDVSLAARQMGHSIKLHCETYHAWMTEEQQRAAFKKMFP